MIACAIVLVGITIRVAFGCMKDTYHIDEGYSAALTNGDWVPGKDTAPHDEWLKGGALFAHCFSDTLAAAGKPDYPAITAATALDVHPPLYYWLFAAVRAAVGPARFAFSGYALNLFLFALSCALVALIAWRAWRDWYALFFALALFAFSSTSISLTIFIRMYELLQTLCLAFLASALFVLAPPGSGKARSAAIGFGIAGLLAASFLGLMTQYYFLLFVAPVALCAFAWLIAKRRFSSLLWGILAVAAGLYLAYRAFPQMASHLTESYRSEQSVDNLVKATFAQKLGNLAAYLKILSANLVPFIALAAIALLAIVLRVKGGKAKTSDESGNSVRRSQAELALFVLSLAVFVVTFAVISVSAPYRTARYIGSFFPVYGLAFIGFTRLVLPVRSARVMLGAAALLVLIHGAFPRNVCAFHEDYDLGADPYYMRDAKPVILITTPEGGSWKNMLPYLNIGKDKRIYVTNEDMGKSVYDKILDIARSSGEKEVYAIVDDYFKKQPGFKQIGYYGFYYVYLVPVK
jgi:hypothetical protein